jgi:transposase InsO family protein
VAVLDVHGHTLVAGTIAQAAGTRARQRHRLSGNMIHHSDDGGQYTSIHITEAVELHVMRPSTGSVGGAFDNALAETTIGLYQTECARSGSPFRNGPFERLGDVDDATGRWVSWYNTAAYAPPRSAPAGRARSRLLRSTRCRPPGRTRHELRRNPG